MKIKSLIITLLSILIISCSSDSLTNPDSIDSDNDGILDINDDCPNTPNGEAIDGNGCSDSQLIIDDVTLSLNVENTLYVENGIDYGNINLVLDNHCYYIFNYDSTGYKYHFGLNNLDFKYIQAYNFYKPYKLNSETINFLSIQTNSNNDSREHINSNFTFNDNLMIWGNYKFTRPIIVNIDDFGNGITMFPYMRVQGNNGKLDGIYETILEYPNGDILKSRIIIDYREDGFVYIVGKVLLNNNTITNTVFSPINSQSLPKFDLYNIQNKEYLVIWNPTGQFQPIFSAHFFNKDVYQ